MVCGFRHKHLSPIHLHTYEKNIYFQQPVKKFENFSQKIVTLMLITYTWHANFYFINNERVGIIVALQAKNVDKSAYNL